ncbi:negative regulator of transcription of ribonucleotide reductase nrd genes and operons [Candidatus Hydrogenisulfobacillus filiaventi]|uniref:Transcriptional repressor NrdR n=1 Tax=Candidatus Hydrogenisulfobacillus filiaventi TaxID=2707344 RepID=A0A6F8ZHL0_9FIRM|nr:negative regulator of transcription of ribonucleotide reductase nrd genes and operons [Candidatus Hydrogenisulfobacillus filiaventi]
MLDSRPAADNREIRRRRECPACHFRFTTRERVEEQTFWVIKKDGRREPFNREKILNGLLTACRKRPVPVEQLETLAAEVEQAIRERFAREVPTEVVGEEVITRLRALDEVAYVRFASVYRRFADAREFQEELKRLEPARQPEPAGERE